MKPPADPLKCAVIWCRNRRDEGAFDGPICVPCLEALRGDHSPISTNRILVTLIESLTGFGVNDD